MLVKITTEAAAISANKRKPVIAVCVKPASCFCPTRAPVSMSTNVRTQMAAVRTPVSTRLVHFLADVEKVSNMTSMPINVEVSLRHMTSKWLPSLLDVIERSFFKTLTNACLTTEVARTGA